MSRLTDYMNSVTDNFESAESQEESSVDRVVDNKNNSTVRSEDFDYTGYSGIEGYTSRGIDYFTEYSDVTDEPLYSIELKRSDFESTDSYKGTDVIAADFRHSNSVYLAKKAQDIGRGINLDIDPNFDLKKSLDAAKIAEEDRKFFSAVTNQKQFDNALEYLQQDKIDEQILSDTSLSRKMIYGLVTGVADPINWIPIGRALKFGTPLVKLGIEGAIIGGLNATERGYVNNDMDAWNISLEAASVGLANVMLVGAGRGVVNVFKSSEFQSIKKGIKEAVTPDVSRWFEMENGELKEVSVGKYGKYKQKAKRWVWEAFNNSPTSQMYNSGDPLLKELAPLIFRERHTNLREDKVVPISNEEAMSLQAYKELEMADNTAIHRDKYIEEGGIPEDFEKGVADGIRNTYVNINTGEILYGVLLKSEQLNILSYLKKPRKKKDAKVKKGQHELGLYDEEHIENFGVSTKFEELAVPDNAHIKNAIKEYVEFWRPIIKRAKDANILDREFGEGGVKATRKALTPELANLPADKVLKAEFETNIVSLGHVVRHYNSYGIYSNISDARAILYREIYLNDKKLSPDQINSIIDEMLPKLVDRNVNVRKSAFENVSSKAKFTKEREVAISDAVLSKLEYLDDNAIGLNKGLWRPLLAEIELDRTARNVGFKSWNDLKDVYVKRVNQGIGKGITKESVNIPNDKEAAKKFIDENVDFKAASNEEAHSYNLELLNATEDLLRGEFGKESYLKDNRILNWLANTKAVRYVEYGGQLFLSCVLDSAALVLKAGISKDIQQLFKGAAKRFFTPLSKQEIKESISFVDRMIQKTRFSDLGYDADNVPFLEKATRFTDKWTGTTRITRVLKETIAEYEYSKIIKECLKKEDADRDFLNKRGITSAYQKLVIDSYRKYGSRDGKLRYIPLSKIEDRSLSDTLRCVAQSLAEQTIQTPGIGDVPRFLRSGVGSFLFMFKSYPFLIYNNVIRPALAAKTPEHHIIQWGLTSVALSCVREDLVDMLNDRETDHTSFKYWRSVFDYASLGAHIFDAASSMEKTVTSNFGTSATSQWSTTSSWIDDTIDIVKSIVMPNRKVNWRKIRNRMPGINYWWARPFTNPLLPEQNNRTRRYTR